MHRGRNRIVMQPIQQGSLKQIISHHSCPIWDMNDHLLYNPYNSVTGCRLPGKGVISGGVALQLRQTRRQSCSWVTSPLPQGVTRQCLSTSAINLLCRYFHSSHFAHKETEMRQIKKFTKIIQQVKNIDENIHCIVKIKLQIANCN